MPILRNVECAICGEWIDVHKNEIAVFPPLADSDSEFRIFSNTILHRKCFVEHPLSRELRSMLEEFYDPSNRFYQQQMELLAYIDELLADDNDSAEPNNDNAPE